MTSIRYSRPWLLSVTPGRGSLPLLPALLSSDPRAPPPPPPPLLRWTPPPSARPPTASRRRPRRPPPRLRRPRPTRPPKSHPPVPPTLGHRHGCKGRRQGSPRGMAVGARCNAGERRCELAAWRKPESRATVRVEPPTAMVDGMPTRSCGEPGGARVRVTLRLPSRSLRVRVLVFFRSKTPQNARETAAPLPTGGNRVGTRHTGGRGGVENS